MTRAMIMMTMTNSFSKNLKADHSCYHFNLSKALNWYPISSPLQARLKAEHSCYDSWPPQGSNSYILLTTTMSPLGGTDSWCANSCWCAIPGWALWLSDLVSPPPVACLCSGSFGQAFLRVLSLSACWAAFEAACKMCQLVPHCLPGTR
jgi:hypothetical protein